MLNSPQQFPAGTTVKAYPASNWPQASLPPSGAPVGAQAAEAVVAAGGSLTFTGLTANTSYYAAAQVGGVWVYLRFVTSVHPKTAADVEAALNQLVTETSAALATKLAAAANLSDLASAATARANLGLGTAAVQAASAFDVAGAGAAAVTAAIDIDTSLKANSDALVASQKAQRAVFDRIVRRGLPEKFFRGLTMEPINLTTSAATVNRAYYFRFVPHRDMKVRGLSFLVTVAAEKATDKVAVALFDAEAKNKLASSGAVEAKTNATGRQDIDFTADVELTGGTVYYVSLTVNTPGGTEPTLLFLTLNNEIYSDIIGANPSERLFFYNSPTFPYATAPAFSRAGSGPMLLVRER